MISKEEDTLSSSCNFSYVFLTLELSIMISKEEDRVSVDFVGHKQKHKALALWCWMKGCSLQSIGSLKLLFLFQEFLCCPSIWCSLAFTFGSSSYISCHGVCSYTEDSSLDSAIWDIALQTLVVDSAATPQWSLVKSALAIVTSLVVTTWILLMQMIFGGTLLPSCWPKPTNLEILDIELKAHSYWGSGALALIIQNCYKLLLSQLDNSDFFFLGEYASWCYVVNQQTWTWLGCPSWLG